ncbi:unnamed protein product, partial [Ectocarpus sp. 8 AP-2014]
PPSFAVCPSCGCGACSSSPPPAPRLPRPAVVQSRPPPRTKSALALSTFTENSVRKTLSRVLQNLSIDTRVASPPPRESAAACEMSASGTGTTSFTGTSTLTSVSSGPGSVMPTRTSRPLFAAVAARREGGRLAGRWAPAGVTPPLLVGLLVFGRFSPLCGGVFFLFE